MSQPVENLLEREAPKRTETFKSPGVLARAEVGSARYDVTTDTVDSSDPLGSKYKEIIHSLQTPRPEVARRDVALHGGTLELFGVDSPDYHTGVVARYTMERTVRRPDTLTGGYNLIGHSLRAHIGKEGSAILTKNPVIKYVTARGEVLDLSSSNEHQMRVSMASNIYLHKDHGVGQNVRVLYGPQEGSTEPVPVVTFTEDLRSIKSTGFDFDSFNKSPAEPVYADEPRDFKPTDDVMTNRLGFPSNRYGVDPTLFRRTDISGLTWGEYRRTQDDITSDSYKRIKKLLEGDEKITKNRYESFLSINPDEEIKKPKSEKEHKAALDKAADAGLEYRMPGLPLIPENNSADDRLAK